MVETGKKDDSIRVVGIDQEARQGEKWIGKIGNKVKKLLTSDQERVRKD
jgi:hypothetical protein